MDEHYTGGHVTSGSYFVFNGVKYGKDTVVLFTERFYDNVGETIQNIKLAGFKYPYYRTFHSIQTEDDHEVWKFGRDTVFSTYKYSKINPDKDIVKIVTPVYYIKPEDLVTLRLNNGTWIAYIWKQTLFYLCCLLISPIFNQWYLIWTIGLYAYIRLSYIELSKGGLYYGR